MVAARRSVSCHSAGDSIVVSREIAACVCVFAGDPGGARVPGALNGEGTLFSEDY